MGLAAGTRLGPYEILAPIGAGGMGDVYSARDTRLGREVALKVAKEEFSERFGREARAVASLNHLNICTLFDVGPNYLVMEMVEGPTLAERIKEGPLPLEEALGIARQIAAALETAHESGIVHRDLKPGNVKIKPDGTVKVLDFGLAKLGGTAMVQSDDSPTLMSAATQLGVILGTAAYMSPEQARGKTVDKRADIWSFGVVLHEMLSGKRLFQGEDLVETLAAVVHKEPDLSGVPERARRLIQKCLVKDPGKRLRDITGMEFLLEEAPAVSTAPSRPQFGMGSRFGLAWVVAGVVAVAAAAVSFIHFREKPQVAQTLRYSLALPEDSTLHSFALSPDGRSVVIAALVKGKQQLWLQKMDALQAQPMAFTDDATYPFWSPDSRNIGFFAENKLKKIAAIGGPAQSLCDAPPGRGATWGPGDVILFSFTQGIRRVAASGGIPAAVANMDGNKRLPVFLPDGRHFLYLWRGGADQNGIWVASLDGKENRRLLSDVSGAVLAPPVNGGPGHILFSRESTLMAVPFDASTARALGDVFPVVEGVGPTTNATWLPASVSREGMLLYSSVSGAGRNQLTWFDRSGKSLATVGAPGGVWDPALSPDEKLVAYQRNAATANDLWIRDLARGSELRFTAGGGNVLPQWAPGGEQIAFASNRGGLYTLYRKTTGGSGQEELLLPIPVVDQPTQWSRDGRFIVYQETDPKTRSDLWVLPMGGTAAQRKPIPFLRTEFNEMQGQLSPDSRWMAFASNRSGRREVYVRPFPPGDGEWSISVAGGQKPRWRADGNEMFFVAADGKMMAVPVKATAGTKPAFEAGVPVALFDAPIPPESTVSGYDVTADGKRFIIAATSGAGTASPPLTVVTNWTAGLNK